jgi:hypothetical protein
MRKNSFVYNDEVDLSRLFNTIWKEKIKIILIIFVTILVSYYYKQTNLKQTNSNQDLFEISVNVKESKKNISENYLFINNFLFDNRKITTEQEDLKDQVKNINKVTVLRRLMNDLLYHQELISVLKKNDSVKEMNPYLSEKDLEEQLYLYSKSFSIKKNTTGKKNVSSDYTVKLNWFDAEEGKKILDDTLKLGLKNLQDTIFVEIENKLRLERQLIISRDQERIKYLMEQSEIAEALDIIEGQVDIIKAENNSIIVDYSSSAAYYLRGFKAIQKEINIIKKRKYKNLSLITQEMQNLKTINSKHWVHYNIFLAETKSLNNNNIGFIGNWKASTFLGLVIGLFYAFIIHFYKSKKFIRNKKSN